MKCSLPVLITTLVVGMSSTYAGPVTDWHTFKAAPATTLSGQGTSNPVMGSASLPSVQGVLVGYFNPMSLTNLGDRIVLSYQVTFTDATNMVDANDNFRFALFDLNGQAPVTAENTGAAGVDGQTDNWRGYWYGIKHSDTSGGSLRERIAALISGDNPFAATGTNSPTAPSLGPVGGPAIHFVSSNTPAGGPLYVGQMLLEKTSAGVALAGYFSGNGATNIFTAKDESSPSPVNFSAVGFLNGGLNCDQVNFQNVAVNYSNYVPAQITSGPTNIQVRVSQSAMFQVTWANGPLYPTFQWRENGTNILNATNATYAIASTTLAQSGNVYSVVIHNYSGGNAISSGAMLTVTNDTPPTLSVLRNGNDLQLSWPVSALHFTLQASPVLATPTVWTNVLSGGVTNQVTLPMNSGGLFYRLSN